MYFVQMIKKFSTLEPRGIYTIIIGLARFDPLDRTSLLGWIGPDPMVSVFGNIINAFINKICLIV